MEAVKVKPEQKNGQSKEIYSLFEEITPARAQEILKNNNINRRISNAAVAHYANQMKNNNWFSETDESIKVSKGGNLLDGQHRLLAIIKSGIPLLLKVTYNLPEDAFRFIDQGKKRSAPDVLFIAGVKNASGVAGIIKSHTLIKRGASSTERDQVSAGLSNEDIFALYQKRPEYWQDANNKAQAWYKSFHRIINPSFIGAHFTLFQDLNVDDAKSFFEKLCTGIGLNNPKDSVRLLREYFLRQLDLKGKKSNTVSYNSALVIKAWNFYRQNKEMSFLKWDSSREAFPKPI